MVNQVWRKTLERARSHEYFNFFVVNVVVVGGYRVIDDTFSDHAYPKQIDLKN